MKLTKSQETLARRLSRFGADLRADIYARTSAIIMAKYVREREKLKARGKK